MRGPPGSSHTQKPRKISTATYVKPIFKFSEETKQLAPMESILGSAEDELLTLRRPMTRGLFGHRPFAVQGESGA